MTSGLPTALYPAAAIRAFEAAVIAQGTSGLTLMRRAGLAAWSTLLRHWPHAQRLTVVCGPGNNGGDGYVLASAARQAQREVLLVEVGDATRRGPDAAECRREALAHGAVLGRDLAALAGREVLVDALFGLGLQRPPAGVFLAAITAMNAAATPILSLDVPAGLHADTGATPGACIAASVTVTFVGLKQGLFTGQAAAHVGLLEFAGLELPAVFWGAEPAPVQRLLPALLRECLAPRPRASHKGNFGHVLVVGGAAGYAGAARLAAEAALRTGAGLVSVACDPLSVHAIGAGRPEIMVHAVTGAEDLRPLLARASVVAIGPGLAQSAWSRALFGAVRDASRPLVVDADALNLLAAEPQYRPDWCLTPHPGEAARLLGLPHASAINCDRFAAARALQARFGGALVLKGAGSLVCAEQGIGVVPGGNPGMASGGMGDVLTGVIAALRAQGLSLVQAARCGAVLHAAAGDAAASAGERGLLASDLLPALRRLANPAA